MILTYLNEEHMAKGLDVFYDESEKNIIEAIENKLNYMEQIDGIKHTLYAIKKFENEKDNYLRCVLVKRHASFVIWLYNVESDGFTEGKYIEWFNFEDAFTLEREAIVEFFKRYE